MILDADPYHVDMVLIPAGEEFRSTNTRSTYVEGTESAFVQNRQKWWVGHWHYLLDEYTVHTRLDGRYRQEHAQSIRVHRLRAYERQLQLPIEETFFPPGWMMVS